MLGVWREILSGFIKWRVSSNRWLLLYNIISISFQASTINKRVHMYSYIQGNTIDGSTVVYETSVSILLPPYMSADFQWFSMFENLIFFVKTEQPDCGLRLWFFTHYSSIVGLLYNIIFQKYWLINIEITRNVYWVQTFWYCKAILAQAPE